MRVTSVSTIPLFVRSSAGFSSAEPGWSEPIGCGKGYNAFPITYPVGLVGAKSGFFRIL
jgi:hypothetical protein